ncbi:hypothetical protein GALMADRAFT_71756 [Galerina marginata CBS 339.88]|uniref:Uncharacterized protein n=1 Tax=Galerina marginata (strain CBS 339.88) TaxID=685588 RepID=A0A067T411_GALM3|nr:hypothetical protein GALMADRAFT_71756 [Galerina marginata CBS 339.88]
MRQREQTAEDAKFRQLLYNLRYRACTKEDINFLLSRRIEISGTGPSTSNENIRNAPIITSLNVHKDRINDLGVRRWAKDHGQKLHDFYSIDYFHERGRKETRHNPSPIHVLNPALQEGLWSLPPSASKEQVPAKLTLCIGLPVMIRNNDAVELCITKGQEAVVVGWDAEKKLRGEKECLNTLFVRLVKPPRSIEIPGLPLNVVPIPATVVTVDINMPQDGHHQSIKRCQVNVLPCFAMTDYASQGRTREWNAVYLRFSKSHQAIYTALSRGATAEGTALLDNVDITKLQGGISGYLRQEFRELEILDKITELRFLNKLPDGVLTELRNPTLRNFSKFKEELQEVENELHPALKATSSDTLPARGNDETWDYSLKNNKKRKANNVHDIGEMRSKPIAKKSPASLPTSKENHYASSPITNNVIIGPRWDNINWSCAYDALYFILYNAWNEEKIERSEEWKLSILMHLLLNGFATNANDPEVNRDRVRSLVMHMYPNDFTMGKNGTDIFRLTKVFLGKPEISRTLVECNTCGDASEYQHFKLTEYIEMQKPVYGFPQSINAQLIDRDLNKWICQNCFKQGTVSYTNHSRFAVHVPNVIVIPIIHKDIIVDSNLHIKSLNASYTLKGTIYYGHYHFTSRFIDSNKCIWFHDGMTGQNAMPETKTLSNVGADYMTIHGGNQCCMAIYYRSA